MSPMKNGRILIEEGVALPSAFNVESEPYADGWRMVTNAEGYALDGLLRKAGWTFLYMAAQVNTTVFGFGKERTVRRAFVKIVEKTRSAKFNCVEIIEAGPKQFFGLFYVYISGHARMIQQP